MPTETENIPNPVNCEKATFTKPPVTKNLLQTNLPELQNCLPF